MNPETEIFFRKLKLIAIGSFCIGLGLFVISKVLSTLAGKDLEESYAQTTYSYQVLVQTNDLELQLQSIQNHSRGYILTGDSVFKNAYNRFVEKAEHSFSALSELLKKRESHDSMIPALNNDINKLTDHTTELLAWKDAGENQRIEKAVSSLKGKKLMDALMQQTVLLKEREQQFSQGRIKQSRKVFTLLDQLTLATSILGSSFLLIAVLFIYSSLRKKEQQTRKQAAVGYSEFVQLTQMQINYDRLQESSMGDAGFMKEMLHGYLEHVPTLITEMEQCRLPEDERQLRSLAHKLRSASQILEIAGVNSDLERIEFYSDPGNDAEELDLLRNKVCAIFREAFVLVQKKVREM